MSMKHMAGLSFFISGVVISWDGVSMAQTPPLIFLSSCCWRSSAADWFVHSSEDE